MGASGEYLDHASLDRAADALLARCGAIVLALTGPAIRVPLPADERFARVASLPGERETVVDYVVPADRMVVVNIWERAHVVGLAQDVVRLPSDPDRAMTLTIVDATHRFGVWLGFLIPDDRWRPVDDAPAPDVSLLVPSRPRTATLHKNIYAVITHVDDRVERMLGWTAEEMLGRRSLEFIHPDDHERGIAQWLEMRARRRSQRVRVRHRRRDGSWLWVEMENAFVGLEDADRLVAVCELTDISDEVAAHEEIGRREKLFRRLAESLPEGLFLVGVDRSIVYANARLASILGVPDAATVWDQLATLGADNRDTLLEALDAAMSDHVDRQIEVEVVDPRTGTQRWCLANVTALTDEEGLPGAIVTLSDVTESVRLRHDLRHQATYDSLTGCLNRASTLAALQRVLDGGQHSAAVLFIDLDQFKLVNDTFGHSAGDQLLAEAAHKITAQARAKDVVGRIGGDEFLMICHGLSHPDDALAVADRLRGTLARTISWAGKSFEISASIGVTIATHGLSARALMIRADQAMYLSKRRSDGTPVFLPAAGGGSVAEPGTVVTS